MNDEEVGLRVEKAMLPQPPFSTQLAMQLSSEEKLKSGEGRELEQEESPIMLSQALMVGLIDAIMALPTMYGYSAMIFQHTAYGQSITALSKVVFLSSAVHEMCFFFLSGLPFAIGQVQDAGLIFLSHIATNVASTVLLFPNLLHAHVGSPAVQMPLDATDDAERELQTKRIVSTAVVTLGVCTAALGVCLVTIGRARLAKFVAYLPMPVIGGYLAFIGYFCVKAGIVLCVTHPLDSWSDWSTFLSDRHQVLLALPGLLTGFGLVLLARYVKNDAVLPVAMIVIPVVFYCVIFVLGYSAEEARDFGWMRKLGATATVTDMVELYDFSQVDWSLVPEQLPVWLAMVFVVAFSSCLDVAAIEMDIGRALDVNSELTTVGWSNVVSGLFGGFTGSYIFSATVFNMRSGCHSRMIGAVVALCEIGIVFAQVDLLAYVPLFFFASTLIFVGIDFIVQWLWNVRRKLEGPEYGIVLLTFSAIQVFGLNRGLGVGVLCSVTHYIVTSASQANLQRVHRQSMVLRSPLASAVIHSHYQRGAIVTLELRGSLFFLSALRVLDEVKYVLGDARRSSSTATTTAAAAGLHHATRASSSREQGGELRTSTMYERGGGGGFKQGSATALMTDDDESEEDVPQSSVGTQHIFTRKKIFPMLKASTAAECQSLIQRTEHAYTDYASTRSTRPQFLVLDFTRVVSLDATAVNSCFNAIGRATRTSPTTTLLYAGCAPSVSTQLRNHGAFEGDHVHEFITLERALAWCEAEVLKTTREKMAKESKERSRTERPLTPAAGSAAQQQQQQAAVLQSIHLHVPTQTRTVETLLQQWLDFRPDIPPAQVAPWLFVGGAHHACNLDTLRSHNITHIINVTKNIPDFFPDHPHLKYRRIVPADIYEAAVEGELVMSDDLPSYSSGGGHHELDSAVDFTDAVAQQQGTGGSSRFGGGVLVHSRFGLKLAPVVATALLVSHTDLSLEQAWRTVKGALPRARLEALLKQTLTTWAQTSLPHKLEADGDWDSGEATLEESNVASATAEEELSAESLAQFFRVTTVEPDTVFYRIGDTAQEVYLLLDGTVDLLGPSDQVLLTLAPGNVFGYVDLHLNRPRTATSLARSAASSHSSVQLLDSSQRYGFGGSSPQLSGMVNVDSTHVESVKPRSGNISVAAITNERLEAMSSTHPELAVKFLRVLIRQASLELSNTWSTPLSSGNFYE